MAIQRQAQDPGNTLSTTDAIKYSLGKTKAKTPATQTTPAEPRLAVGKDLLYTIVVFGVLVAVLYFFSLRFR